MTTSDAKLTPMWRQYLSVKAQYPDTILLWRLGDFYEAFEDDAKLLAAELDVTLTRRGFGKNTSEIPMAGVPYHAVENYVARLLQLGYRVAIAEQTSPTDSSQADTRAKSVFQREDLMRDRPTEKKMVDREVVRVLTPGTLTEPGLIDARSNNYLAAAIVDGPTVGVAFCDISTGEFAATELTGQKALIRLEGELMRLQPAEVLVSDNDRNRPHMLQPASGRLQQNLEPMRREERERLLPHERVARKVEGEDASGAWVQGRVTPWPAWRWDRQTASDALKQQFGAGSLHGFGLGDKPLAARAAGAVLQYLQETQRSAVAQIDSLRCYSVDAFMFLDPQTRRNLELLESSGARKRGSLIDVLDQTRTPMGARLLRQWVSQPLLEIEPLLRRQDAIARFVENAMLRAEVRAALKNVGDMERTVNRVVQGVALPRDLVRLREGLQAVPQLVALLGDTPLDGHAERVVGEPPPDDAFFDDDLFDDVPAENVDEPANPALIDPCLDILKLLERAIADRPPALLGGWDPTDEENVIRRGFAPEIDGVVRASNEARNWMMQLESKERERTGIKSLKVDCNNVFGWYIEVSKTTPEHMIPPQYQRKQTLVGAERYVTGELKEYEAILESAKTRLNELEKAAFNRVMALVSAQAKRLLATARLLAELDVYAALADVAVRGNYVRPRLTTDTGLRIVAGRHPVVEQTIEEPFVANDVDMDARNTQILIITGPNMAGKSTYLRQVALIVLLAQIGAYVPAAEAQVGIVDRIFTRIGAQDDIATGQSTFMIEMTEAANILHNATARSLVILDELGRGTSTYDGLSIARAVIEYMHNHPKLGARTLFATHYHELTELAELLPRARNYNVAVAEEEGTIVFLRRIVPGGADRSYGIHVAELAGMPPAVVRRANEVLETLEGRGDKQRQRAAMRQVAAESEPSNELQLSLWTAEASHPVVDTLQELEVEELTPIQALTKLYELKGMLNNGKRSR
ncbi:MAG TPA: DNA mismatch repair protein MutS [Herpetosiphonaceae bacterium]|nr:DNA mismatch repair protein MutS [Herpetosiphonaceae bacterium]